MEIFIDNRQDKINIDTDIEEAIKLVIKRCLEYENVGLNYEVSVSIVNNNEIKELNKKFRKKDTPTDVLSFPMIDDDIIENQIPILGDIVISAEKALEQSKEFNHSFKREISYLTAHSVFHLLGYDHSYEEEKSIMREKEKSIMKSLKIFKDTSC
ncbi:MAG: rRNA maturation RNase YbeY [Firmicutes bacterium]|nr:rRNA maturation RNase YbeY [Bacillota bacterium]